jgi:hypothetical protein
MVGGEVAGGTDPAERVKAARGDAAMTGRFVRLLWMTDFADPRRARTLDERPLYLFLRDEDAFRAAS